MTRPFTQKMVKKSVYWHRHGKHAKIDPFFIRHERKRPRNRTVWFGSVQELFKR